MKRPANKRDALEVLRHRACGGGTLRRDSSTLTIKCSNESCGKSWSLWSWGRMTDLGRSELFDTVVDLDKLPTIYLTLRDLDGKRFYAVEREEAPSRG